MRALPKCAAGSNPCPNLQCPRFVVVHGDKRPDYLPVAPVEMGMPTPDALADPRDDRRIRTDNTFGETFARASIAESGLSSRDYFQNVHASVYACLLQK